ncbi:MAG: sulfatase [Candidatus Tectomicrobia bacterium]
MPQRPNVIILMLDTARAQNFSCYGYERPTSPNIDAIAAEGVIYEQAIAPGCWSLPSQVSLLSGMFPIKHGAHELHLQYDQSYPLLPEILREAGYRTLGISPNSWMSDEFGVTRGFDTYLKLWQYWHTMPANTPQPFLARKVNQLYSRHVFPRRNRARHVNGHALKHLATTPEPFFLYAIYWDIHLPYHPRDSHATRWLPAGVTPDQARRVNRSNLRYFAGQVPMSDDDFDVLRACYDGALATVDEEVGRLVAYLRQRDLLDRTVLIITSDHGENLGEHGLMSHAYSLHDTLIHVPLIIRYPECFSPGQRVTHQVQLTDIVPTVLDAAKIEVPHVSQELQGESLLGLVPDNSEERLAYAEMLAPHPSMQTVNRRAGFPEDTPRPAYDRALRCLRTPDYKLIWASDDQHALYDLHADPHETINCFADEPKLAAEMMETLQAWKPPDGTPLRQSAPNFDHALRQRLRDLGYIH